MQLVISSWMVFMCYVGVGLAFPWNPFQMDFEQHHSQHQYQNPQQFQDSDEDSTEFVGPAFFGQLHNPRLLRNPQPEPSYNFLGNGIISGINLFDNLIPPVMQNAVRPIDKNELDIPKNFTRSRRHENGTTTTTTTIEPVIEKLTTTTTSPLDLLTTTESFIIITPISTPIMEDKMDTDNKPNTADLELMISQLNKALTYIQTHGNQKVQEEITNTTSTEKLVQFISTNVELLTKNKNPETRNIKIKQISKALDILLNRIAVSAKDLLPKVKAEKRPVSDPILMAKIVQHVSELKKNLINEKVNNGYELSSAELDGGLTAKFRPVRQGNGDDDEDDNNRDETNSIDGNNKVNNDAEEIPTNAGTTSTTTAKTVQVTARQQGSSEQQSSSQEGGGNLVANLLSSFLGSLSKPDGGVDVDAIVGLVSGLSVQRDDGTFDFSGLTDLLQSFLGGDENGEGGSDVGAFLGGLLGAILQGSANPPGPKGTGRLTGNLVANILPGLSGPPPPTSSEEAGNGMQQGKPIDSGSFLAGLLTSMLGSSSGTSSGSKPPAGNGGDDQKMGSAGFFIKIKQQIFKTIFSLITSILGASSSGITQASGASSGASSQKFSGKH